MSLSHEYGYLIHGDNFIPVACTGNIKEKQNKQYTSGLSLGGNRRVLHYGRTIAREWSLSGDLPVHVAQNLYTLTSNPQYAQATYSLLTPQSMLYNMQFGDWGSSTETNLELAGDVTVPVKSGNAESNGRLVASFAPVNGGTRVTGSFYARANSDTTGYLEFFDSSRKYLTGKAVKVAVGEPLTRYSVTSVSPNSARYMRLTLVGANYFAGNPAITLGSTLRPYMPPLACEKVYLEPLEGGYSVESLEAAIQSCGGSGGIVEGVSLSILEVS